LGSYCTTDVKEWKIQLVSQWEKRVLEVDGVGYQHWEGRLTNITLEKHGSLGGSREPITCCVDTPLAAATLNVCSLNFTGTDGAGNFGVVGRTAPRLR